MSNESRTEGEAAEGLRKLANKKSAVLFALKQLIERTYLNAQGGDEDVTESLSVILEAACEVPELEKWLAGISLTRRGAVGRT